MISIFCEFSHYDWSLKSSGIYCCTFGVAVHQRFNINDMDSQSQDGLQGSSGAYCQMISSASMLMKSCLETLYFLRMSCFLGDENDWLRCDILSSVHHCKQVCRFLEQLNCPYDHLQPNTCTFVHGIQLLSECRRNMPAICSLMEPKGLQSGHLLLLREET